EVLKSPAVRVADTLPVTTNVSPFSNFVPNTSQSWGTHPKLLSVLTRYHSRAPAKYGPCKITPSLPAGMGSIVEPRSVGVDTCIILYVDRTESPVLNLSPSSSPSCGLHPTPNDDRTL